MKMQIVRTARSYIIQYVHNDDSERQPGARPRTHTHGIFRHAECTIFNTRTHACTRSLHLHTQHTHRTPAHSTTDTHADTHGHTHTHTWRRGGGARCEGSDARVCVWKEEKLGAAPPNPRLDAALGLPKEALRLRTEGWAASAVGVKGGRS